MPSIHTDADPPPPRRRRPTVRNAAVAAALIAAAAIAVLAGLGATAAGSSGTATGAQPTDAPTPVVRRHSDTTGLTLSGYYDADLDSLAPNWGAAQYSSLPTGHDIGYLGDESAPGHLDAAAPEVDLAPVTGAPSYATCAAATGYSSAAAAPPGAAFCVRTSDHRYAYLRVRSSNAQAVTLDAVVWDPPFGTGG